MMIDLGITTFIAISQLLVAYVAANPPGRHEPKQPYKRKILVLLIVGFVANIWGSIRQYDQRDAPEVAWDSREWEFPHLEANKVNHLRQVMVVSSGTARQAQFYLRAFVEHGAPSVEQERQAIIRFKKLIVDTPARAEDTREKTPRWYDETFNFDETQLGDLEGGADTLYAMMYAEWKNKQGATFKTYAYSRMSTPTKDGYVGQLAWHGFTE